jgi:UDP-3-O-[3-hydroxymyristoyl] glucosamine N-acyltransferase
LGPRTVAALAAVSGADLAPGAAGDLEIVTVGPLDASGPGILSYCENVKAADLKAAGGVVFAPLGTPADAVAPGATLLLVKDPKGAFARAAPLLAAERRIESGAAIHPSADIDSSVVIGPGAVIGAGVRIGRGGEIGPNAVIGVGVTVGRGARIGAGAVLACALIGDEVVIGPNAVVGRAGFGLAGSGAQGLTPMPQFGRAILQDGVSIGALTCVDRGAFGDTVVGEGAKIDNLVQIAHNVIVGRNVIIVACSGISGSVTIGDGALLGGAVGVADHVNIGPGAILAARSGVIGDVPGGTVWAGYPARPRGQWLREAAWVARAARRKRET